MNQDNLNLIVNTQFFSQLDESFFPEHRSLVDIAAKDCAIKNYKKGDIIIREGDYGTSAYVLVSGSAWYIQDKMPDKLLGRVSNKNKKGAFDLILNLFKKNKSRPTISGIIDRTDKILDQFNKTLLEIGDVFGETSGRDPRSATIIANENSVVIEIKWQGVRDLRKYSPEVREIFDSLYRARNLEKTIKNNSLFLGLNSDEINSLTKEAILETFGDPENIEPESEKEIITEGSYINGLLIIRSGFAKVTNKDGQTIKYLSRGDCFGVYELYQNHNNHENLAHQYSLTYLGYLETIFIPKSLVEKVILPKIDVVELEKYALNQSLEKVDPNLLNFLVSNRLNNGRSIMMIDLESCTRCNDCTNACAMTHDNIAKFKRKGLQHDKYLIAQSCMHCLEPYCMNNCPTGAIYRNEANGEVVINEQTCIGCANCAESCVYNNISMLKIDGDVLMASKCDLCNEQSDGPACERSCPTDAIKMVNLSDFKSLIKWTENH